MRRIYRLIRREMGCDPPYREVAVRESDIFLVSYPKSGNTWLRLVIGKLKFGKEFGLTNLGEGIPDIYRDSGRAIERMQSPRIIKSHEYFDPRYRRLIYVVRDPRDVAISYYSFLIKLRILPERAPFDGYLERYVKGTVSSYGSWEQNARSWYYNLGKHNLLIRYEDLVESFVPTIGQVSRFLLLEATQEDIGEVRNQTSLGHLRREEQALGQKEAFYKASRKDVAFFGAGRPGGWQEHPDAGLINERLSVWGDTMKLFGYE